MFRILRIFIIASVALVLTAPVWAGESEDVQQIRELLYREIDGHFEGDLEQVLSCYAPGVVVYHAYFGGPELWEVVMVGLDALRKSKEALVVGLAASWTKHPQWDHGREVLHVHIKDGHAIALTQQWNTKPDSTARETIFNKFQDVVTLAKIKGEWKITSSLSRLKLWIEALQPNACICGHKLPIDGFFLGVASVSPGFRFLPEFFKAGDSSVQALLGQNAQLNFSDVEPTAVLGGKVDL